MTRRPRPWQRWTLLALFFCFLSVGPGATPVHTACPGPEVINGVADDDGCADTVFVILRLDIRDPHSEQPVRSRVLIRGRQQRYEATTEGHLEHILATPGIYTIDIVAAGYAPHTLRLRLSRGTAVSLGIRLQPS